MPEQPATDRLAAALRDLEDAANWLRGMSDAPGFAAPESVMREIAAKLDAARETVAKAHLVVEEVAHKTPGVEASDNFDVCYFCDAKSGKRAHMFDSPPIQHEVDCAFMRACHLTGFEAAEEPREPD